MQYIFYVSMIEYALWIRDGVLRVPLKITFVTRLCEKMKGKNKIQKSPEAYLQYDEELFWILGEVIHLCSQSQ